MTQRRSMQFLVIRYVPHAVLSRHLDVGVVLFEKVADRVLFAEGRFMESMEQVLAFDPDADLEVLQSTFRDIERSLNSPTEREDVLHALQDTFSNTLQVVGPKPVLVLGDPIVELNRLRLLHVEPIRRRRRKSL